MVSIILYVKMTFLSVTEERAAEEANTWNQFNQPEDWGSTFLRNVETSLLSHLLQEPRRL